MLSTLVVNQLVRRCPGVRQCLFRQYAAQAGVTHPFNYISGKRVESQSEHSVQVYNPATGETLCFIADSNAVDVNAAVQSAKKAFDVWSEITGLERGKLLREVARQIRDNKEELARADVVDVGKPIWEARCDIDGCADAMDHHAAIAGQLAGQYFSYANGSFAYTRREPLGVCGGIGAWNYPFQMAVFKSAPALACGNTMVFKPSQFTPLTAVMLAEIYTKVGLPDGCFNVIQGSGQTGALLCSHSDIAKMTFTGSVETGTKVMTACAKDIKKVTLELGGKSPMIVFADADLDNAVKGAMLANFLNQGQVCSNGTRVFVERTIAKQFLEKLVAKTTSLKIGDPLADDTAVGAMISPEQADKVLNYIASAKEEGASVACGGESVVPSDARLAGGRYISPCILTNCTDNMKAVQEEIFGPVLSLLEFDTEEEAVTRANDSPFGLAGGVFTRDISRAHRVVSRLQVGATYINTYNVYPPEIPFGGNKKSGIGRELGSVVVEYFTQLKSVYVEAGDVDYPF